VRIEDEIDRPGGGMHPGRSNYPKSRIYEKALSKTEVACGSLKLNDMRKSDHSLFSLLLEIERRLCTEGRNDQVEQGKRSKEKDRQRRSVNNLCRYRE
jgi:hypothetical protein